MHIISKYKIIIADGICQKEIDRGFAIYNEFYLFYFLANISKVFKTQISTMFIFNDWQ